MCSSISIYLKIYLILSYLNLEMFTDADYFGVTFPLDLDVNIKAVLLAATFLIVSQISVIIFIVI